MAEPDVLFCSYPLILSIETHCGVKQQQTMAFYMRQVFGDKLYTEVVNPDAVHLPSPEALRKKIIIKVRIKIFRLSVFCVFDHLMLYMYTDYNRCSNGVIATC